MNMYVALADVEDSEKSSIGQVSSGAGRKIPFEHVVVYN